MSDESDIIDFAASLTVAWLSNPNTRVAADDIPAFLRSMYQAVSQLSQPPAPPADEAPSYDPVVSVRKSLASPDRIISMINGKPYRTLKRHLSTNGLTPNEYRQRYGLKPDYPMVAPGYSEKRRSFALENGLGRKPAAQPAEVPAQAAVPKSRGKGVAAAKKAAKAPLDRRAGRLGVYRASMENFVLNARTQ